MRKKLPLQLPGIYIYRERLVRLLCLEMSEITCLRPESETGSLMKPCLRVNTHISLVDIKYSKYLNHLEASDEKANSASLSLLKSLFFFFSLSLFLLSFLAIPLVMLLLKRCCCWNSKSERLSSDVLRSTHRVMSQSPRGASSW